MRYELDDKGYILNVFFGCYGSECIEYTGETPEGYETLSLWAENANIKAYKLIDGNLVYDENRDKLLQDICLKETEDNSYTTQKYVNEKLRVSTAVVTDELATETTGNSYIVINDAGNYEIPEFKIQTNTSEIVNVVSSNKNILGIKVLTTTINGVEIIINSDGTINFNGTSTDTIEFDLNGSSTNKEMIFLIKDNINYAISGLTNNVSLSLYSYDGTDRTLVSSSNNETINLSNSFKITQATLNIASGVKFENVLISPQIEIGEPTNFVKHEETTAIGILENGECFIDGLMTYEDTTIIMIDQDVTSNIRYYKYQYLTEKFAEIEVLEGEIRSTVVEIDNTVEGQNQKISEVTQKVGELSSKISEVADVTTSKESLNGTVNLEGINESEPIYVKIHSIGENISYLYPSDNLYPSNNLYPKGRTLRFTNTITDETIDYELPTDLLYYDADNYDEFILDYDMQSCTVNKRVGYNADGTTYVLETPSIIRYTYPKIALTDGDYVVTLLGYSDVYMFVRLMTQNIYTTQFATKAEVSSEIKQTSQEIELSVDKKLTSYPTTTEMNSAINISAENITSSVSKTYATKTDLVNTKSEIKQTTDSITSTVSKKVGNDEVISKINQSAETVGINADKIELSANDVLNLLAGNTINLSSKNIKISSTHLQIGKDGKLKVIGTGSSTDLLRVENSDSSSEFSYMQPMGAGFVGSNGRIDIFAKSGNADFSGIDITDTDGNTIVRGGRIQTPAIRSQKIYSDDNVTNSPNMYITSSGNVRRTTGSSQRWKTDITEEIEERLNPEALYNLPIKQFKYKDDCISENDVRKGKNILGFIAEDVAKIYEPASQYDENGNVEMWNAQVMIPAMLKLIQDLRKEIKEMKGE